MNQRILTALFLGASLSAFADVAVTENTVMESLVAEKAEVGAGAELHLTGAQPLAEGASVNLLAEGAAVVFESLRPSELDLSAVTVAGRPLDASADRVSIYGNGAIVIAGGWGNPLTIYTEENGEGKSMVCEKDCYYRGELVPDADSFLEQHELGDFDNGIRSFRLRRGYAATFATNPDGTGFSRNFVAADGDIVFDEMPTALEFTSFIRVCRYDWVGKRGWCGEDDAALTRSAWYYTWGASSESYDDYEFVPMRHNKWWDGWDKIGSRTDASCVLGYNEPDHADQSDLGPQYAISQWPEFMKSGLRVGSPAPDAISKDWLIQFMAMADTLNLRVDFVATHMYWNSQDPDNLARQIETLCKGYYKNRPMWITEWNNGANWTSEWWPDGKGTRLDAEFNVLLDENGLQTEVVRPHTEANSAVQAEWLGRALKAFDECPWLERHSFYNWVEDARSVVIEGKLTPAGKVFASFNSRPGYNTETAYEHQWRIVPPVPTRIRSTSTMVRVDFNDFNGETAAGYVVERRINAGRWEQIAYIENGVDYNYTKNPYFVDHNPVNGVLGYRMRGVSYLDGETLSIPSRVISVTMTNAAGLSEAAVADGTDVYADGGVIFIEAAVDSDVCIYRPDGTVAASVRCSSAEPAQVEGLARGLYIVLGRKVVL